MVQITDHMKADVLYWLAFFVGQWLFLLKRMSLAVRSPLNGVKTRRAYLAKNWDVLLIRSVLEFAVIFYPYRHVDINSLIDKMGWAMPFHIPQAGIVALGLGFVSDSMMDWLAMQERIGPIVIPKWLKETIPQLPQVQHLVNELNGKSGSD